MLYIAYVLGKRAKLRELHRLQRDGLLKITYTRDDQLKHMLYEHDAIDDEEDHLDAVAYRRKDREERREDWAIRMKREG